MAVMLVIGTVVTSLGTLTKNPRYAFPMLITSGAAFVILVVLLTLRTRTRLWVSIVSILLLSGLLLSLVWINHQFLFQSGQPFELFAGDKIFALAVGLVAPPVLWVGLTVITAAAVVPLIQYFLLAPEIVRTLPIQEPWLTVVYVVVAWVVYIFRLNWYKTQLQAARDQSRAAMLQEFAHLLIYAQHLTNSPLQTIENAVAIIRFQNPEQENLTKVMKRALMNVREVILLFSYCDSYIDWDEMELPKSVEELEKRMKDLIERETLRD